MKTSIVAALFLFFSQTAWPAGALGGVLNGLGNAGVMLQSATDTKREQELLQQEEQARARPNVSMAPAQPDPMTACMNELANAPELQVLQSKAPVLFAKQTFEMLTNEEKSAGGERVAIKAWGQGYDRCIAVGADYRGRSPRNYAAIVERGYADVLAMIAELYTGNLTYGEFARRRAALNTEMRSSLQRAKEDAQRAQAQQTQQIQALQQQQHLERQRELDQIQARRDQARLQQQQQQQNGVSGVTQCFTNSGVTNCYR